MSGFRAPLLVLSLVVPGTPAPDLPYVGDATIYDSTGATGAIGSGQVQAGDAIYDSADATGSVTGATILSPDVTL